jgi:murein DD-endopeptidase MepM/ murein hydrolase activator NlpD
MTAAALLASVAVITILQPALAYSVPAVAQAPLKSAVPELWQAPLEQVRVTGFFGVRRNVLPTPHKGIDFAAARGTPVHAAAGGMVVAAGPITENQGRYGNTVIIDHGGRRSLYAHLDSVSVHAGQRVAAGQHIGAVGQSGVATGPHLHLEMRQDGQAVDPAPMFANLDAHATAHALKVRRQQQPSKG